MPLGSVACEGYCYLHKCIWNDLAYRAPGCEVQSRLKAHHADAGEAEVRRACGGVSCNTARGEEAISYLCSPRPAFWISMTFLPISRRICCRHLSASTTSWTSVARYGLFCFGSRASCCFDVRSLQHIPTLSTTPG